MKDYSHVKVVWETFFALCEYNEEDSRGISPYLSNDQLVALTKLAMDKLYRDENNGNRSTNKD